VNKIFTEQGSKNIDKFKSFFTACNIICCAMGRRQNVSQSNVSEGFSKAKLKMKV